MKTKFLKTKFFLIIFIIITNNASSLLVASTRLWREKLPRKRKNKKTALEKTLQEIRIQIAELQNDLELHRANNHLENDWDRHIVITLVDTITDLQEKAEKLSKSIKKK